VCSSVHQLAVPQHEPVGERLHDQRAGAHGHAQLRQDLDRPRNQGLARSGSDEQGVGLPAAAVEGQHAFRVQRFAQWVLPDQRIQLGCEQLVPAKREVRLDPRCAAGVLTRFQH
jgi:hypothetical protein